MTEIAVERVQERVEALRSDALHAYDPTYRPRDTRASVQMGEPSTQANLQAPLTCEAPPGAFLVLDAPDGGRSYVRAAALTVRDGRLVDGDGLPLLGYPQGAAAGVVGELRIAGRDGLLSRAVALRIECDGSVRYARRTLDTRGSAATQWLALGRLALATFEGGIPRIGAPGERTTPPLDPRVQGGRVDLPRALERLQEAYLQLDALRAARTAQDAGDRTALGIVK
ncbi:hypothetical protein EPN44_15025 [bacterium]|nr:MAG: hypothetical protein EPN44_15025 [bacterium]